MRKFVQKMSAAVLFAAALAAPAFGQIGTGITYQGRLKLSGAVVNSSADFQYRLFNSSQGGSQIGNTINVSNQQVVDGLFTATPDFGVNAFNGEWNWGYDGVLWYAVQESYGGPAAYQRFVDACHARGLAVIQDPRTADAPEMPEAAMQAVPTARVFTLERMASFLGALPMQHARSPRGA